MKKIENLVPNTRDNSDQTLYNNVIENKNTICN